MIKKGYLFSLVVLCSLFSLIACKKPVASDGPELLRFNDQKVSFDILMERGFVPPAIRLPDSYVNDKIESKAKKLSYDFYYYRLMEGENFSDVSDDKLFSPTCIFATTTISEEDAGLDSKAKIKYSKLKEANGGGEICIGTRFVLGVKVKDQSDNLVYHAVMQNTVYAHASTARSEDANKIRIPGDQRGFTGDVKVVNGGSGAKVISISYNSNLNITEYELEGVTKFNVALAFGEFGTTNTVILKQ